MGIHWGNVSLSSYAHCLFFSPLNNFMEKMTYRVKARLEQKVILTVLFLKLWVQIKHWVFPDPI